MLVRGLCRPRIALKSVSFNAIMTLALRPLLYAQFTENLMTMFVIHVMSVPALILHIKDLASEVFIKCLCIHIVNVTYLINFLFIF